MGSQDKNLLIGENNSEVLWISVISQPGNANIEGELYVEVIDEKKREKNSYFCPRG